MRRPKLDEDAVREIVRLHGSGTSVARLAVEYDRTTSTIYDIVTGRTYQEITGVVPNPRQRRQHRAADYEAHEVRQRRAEENEARGDAAELAAVCVDCGDETTVKAKALIARPWLIRCRSHDGRRT